MTNKEQWIRNDHSWYNEHTKDILSKDQWKKKHLSIIWPSRTTHNTYEIYDWSDIERFDSLEEAQDFWDELIKNSRAISEDTIITKRFRDEYEFISTVPEDYN